GMMKQDSASSQGVGTMRGLLVASQLALSLMLLVGAGLMARAFIGLLQVPLGFKPRGVVTLRVDLPPMRFRAIDEREAFFDSAVTVIRQIPGVDSVGIGLPIPLSGRPLTRRVSFGPDKPERVVSALVVFSNYAETLGVPLRDGRLFSAEDRNRTDALFLVDE